MLTRWLLRRRLSLERRWWLLGVLTWPLVCECTSLVLCVNHPVLTRTPGRPMMLLPWPLSKYGPIPGTGVTASTRGFWRGHNSARKGHRESPATDRDACAGVTSHAAQVRSCIPEPPLSPVPPHALELPPRLRPPLSSLNFGNLSCVYFPSAALHPRKRANLHEGLRPPCEVKATGPGRSFRSQKVLFPAVSSLLP